jgi:hypothetical protein
VVHPAIRDRSASWPQDFWRNVGAGTSMIKRYKLFALAVAGTVIWIVIVWYAIDWYVWRDWDRTGIPRSPPSTKVGR